MAAWWCVNSEVLPATEHRFPWATQAEQHGEQELLGFSSVGGTWG